MESMEKPFVIQHWLLFFSPYGSTHVKSAASHL